MTETEAQSVPSWARVRKLRIAVSVFFGLLTVALCLLWVRSYSRADILYGNLPGLGGFEIDSLEGRLELLAGPSQRGWGVGSNSTEDWQRRRETLRQFNFQSGTNSYGSDAMAGLSHLVIAGAASLAFLLLQVEWPARFSMRTLLIATTLLAVVLGFGVWLSS